MIIWALFHTAGPLTLLQNYICIKKSYKKEVSDAVKSLQPNQEKYIQGTLAQRWWHTVK